MEKALEQPRQAEREADRPSKQAEARAVALVEECTALHSTCPDCVGVCIACLSAAIQAERDAFLRMVRDHSWRPTGAGGKEFTGSLGTQLADRLTWEMGAK